MSKKNKIKNDLMKNDEMRYLIQHPLFEQRFHIDFELADLNNDTVLFSKIYNDAEMLKFCILHSNNTIFEWKNWKEFLNNKNK